VRVDGLRVATLHGSPAVTDDLSRRRKHTVVKAKRKRATYIWSIETKRHGAAGVANCRSRLRRRWVAQRVSYNRAAGNVGCRAVVDDPDIPGEVGAPVVHRTLDGDVHGGVVPDPSIREIGRRAS